MKISPQTNTNTDKVPYKFVIPFEEPSPDDDDDRKTLSFTLRNDPSQGKNSTTWVRTIQEFENGTPEELLLLLNAMDEICTGQSLDTPDQKIMLVRRIFKGSALTAFEGALPSTNGPVTDDMWLIGIQAIKESVFPDPPQAARTQKKAMKALKKPYGISFRAFANRMHKLNKYIALFPRRGGTVPKPFPEEEFLEMLHDALPLSGYQDVMKQHGYEPDTSDLDTFIKWVETRCEPMDKKFQAEVLAKPIPRKQGKRKSAKNGKQSGERPNKRAKMFCMFHGNDRDHTTEECKVLKAMCEERKSGKEKSGKKSGNWNSKGKKSQDFHATEVAKAICGNEDFHAMIRNVTVKTCNQILKAQKRMRDSDDEDVYMVDDQNTKYKNSLKQRVLFPSDDEDPIRFSPEGIISEQSKNLLSLNLDED